MPTMGERLWGIGKSPSQNLTFLLFGLFAVLAGFLLRAYGIYVGATAALSFVAAALGGIGAFFVTVSLFLGAFAGIGESNGTGLRIAALIAAVVVLVILL